MAWVLTKNLQAFRDQMNAVFPNRDKTSDGTIGDTAHQAESSGHNPDLTANAEYKDGDSKDEVRALDVDSDTGDPNVSMEDIVQHLLVLARAGDLWMIRYMIFNRRIWRASNSWKQEAYTGASPHTEHLHLSGAYSQSADEDTSADYHLEDLVAITQADANLIADTLLERDGFVPNYGNDKDTNPYIKPEWALGRASLNNTMLYALRDWYNGFDSKATGLLNAILAAVSTPEDTAALATQIAAALVPAVVASLADSTSLTEEEVQAASERAVRNVLGTLDAG